VEGSEPDVGSADLEARLRRQFAFLPNPILEKIENGGV
jgi:hypothetical protein